MSEIGVGTILTLALYGVATLAAVAALFGRRHVPAALVTASLGAAVLAHALVLAARWATAGGPSLAALGDALMACAWLVAAGGLCAQRIFRLRGLLTFVAPAAGVGFAAGSLAAAGGGVETPAARAAELAGVALKVHVATAIAAYACFALASVAGLMFLWQERALRQKRLDGVAARLPALETLDRALCGSLWLGFPLLTVTVVLGSARQGLVGGLDAGWLGDPKVIAVLVTWVVYGLTLQLRMATVLDRRRVALLTVAGFALTLVAWIGTRHAL